MVWIAAITSFYGINSNSKKKIGNLIWEFSVLNLKNHWRFSGHQSLILFVSPTPYVGSFTDLPPFIATLQPNKFCDRLSIRPSASNYGRLTQGKLYREGKMTKLASGSWWPSPEFKVQISFISFGHSTSPTIQCNTMVLDWWFHQHRQSMAISSIVYAQM